MVNIQWFPGHMAKALKQFKRVLPTVDIVFELVDARCPASSINPEIKRISRGRPHLLILTKADLADPNATQRWRNYFERCGYATLAIDAKRRVQGSSLVKRARAVIKPKRHRPGVRFAPVKAVCVGVPNVGKSTFLNRLVGHRSAAVGNRPGITRGPQWLRAGHRLVLLDTPGILWHKFQSQVIADKLSLVGAVKAGRYYPDDVAIFALKFFKKRAPRALERRYRLNAADLKLNTADLLLKITKHVGMRSDYDRAALRIILDTRKGKLGRYTLDRCPR